MPFPFTDLTSITQRPALILSADALNQNRPDVLVAAITSQIPSQLAEDEILISFAEAAQWGLPKACHSTDKTIFHPSVAHPKISRSRAQMRRWKRF